MNQVAEYLGDGVYATSNISEPVIELRLGGHHAPTLVYIDEGVFRKLVAYGRKNFGWEIK